MGSNEVDGVVKDDCCVRIFGDISFGAEAINVVEIFKVGVECRRGDPVEKVAKSVTFWLKEVLVIGCSDVSSAVLDSVDKAS